MSEKEDSDDDFQAPTPSTDWDNDDDEPPAAGAVTVEFKDDSMRPSTAPTAEPNHRANPEKIAL